MLSKRQSGVPREFRREQTGPFPLQMLGTSRQTGLMGQRAHGAAEPSPGPCSGCLREFPAPCGGARESRAPFPRARFKSQAGFGCGLLTGPSRFLRKRRPMAPLGRAGSRPSAGPGHLARHRARHRPRPGPAAGAPPPEPRTARPRPGPARGSPLAAAADPGPPGLPCARRWKRHSPQERHGQPPRCLQEPGVTIPWLDRGAVAPVGCHPECA